MEENTSRRLLKYSQRLHKYCIERLTFYCLIVYYDYRTKKEDFSSTGSFKTLNTRKIKYEKND